MKIKNFERKLPWNFGENFKKENFGEAKIINKILRNERFMHNSWGKRSTEKLKRGSRKKGKGK